jgi:hypothetical protein
MARNGAYHQLYQAQAVPTELAPADGDWDDEERHTA